MVNLFPHDYLELHFEPEADVLVARWQRDLSAPEAIAGYEALRAAAQAHGRCRRWLLDARRRRTYEPRVLVYVSREFLPDLATILGGTVRIACLATPQQHEASRSHALLPKNLLDWMLGCKLAVFSSEAEARAWLAATG